jgi:hypothetical protein
MQPKVMDAELTISERDNRAAGMKLSGLTYEQIADDLGISRTTAFEAVERAMKAVPFEEADTLRKIELAHLDKAQSKALEILEKQHVAISASGKVVYTQAKDGKPGEPVLDDSVALKAVDSLVKVQGRRAKLLGLDAPTRVQAMIAIITLDDQKADITNLFERLKPRELVEG